MQVFTALIRQGVSVNAKLRHISSKGCHHELTTPLIAAVYYDQVAFIHALVEMAPPAVFQQRLQPLSCGGSGNVTADTVSSSSVPGRAGGRGSGCTRWEYIPTYTLGPAEEGLDVNCTNMLGMGCVRIQLCMCVCIYAYLCVHVFGWLQQQ